MKHARHLLAIILIGCAASTLVGQTQQERALNSASHEIGAILDSISASRIHAYLDTLVGFYTRHTMSDTTSDSIGIGAARRWIYRKFQEISQASGGRLQPMYFDFDATICGIFGRHRNVMAILPGTLTPNRYFIVSGHMDNRGHPSNACLWEGLFSPGANDDGSGTAISIELARVMSQYQFDASIIFMAVTGEDEGLFGSIAYARYAKQNNIRIDGMLTNDVVGNIKGENGIIDSMSVRHFSSVEDATIHRQLARYFRLKSNFYFPAFTINLRPERDRPGRGGDHMPFQDSGYAAVRFTEPNENLANQHSPLDVVDSMSPAYSARVARASAAGLASMAWAPETPGGLQAADSGNGTHMVLQWPSTNTEPDFAGYRVAVRDSGGIYYSNIIDVGNIHRYVIAGLTPGVALYVGISAYDTAGNESIFSREVLVRPSVTPTAPAGVRSTSFPTNIRISWLANPQLDIVRYRIYRSTFRSVGFSLYDSVGAGTTQYFDNGATPQTLYYYHVRALDNTGLESLASIAVPGQLATHNAGILVVDGTRDGSGGALTPTDEAVDSFYVILLRHAAGPLSHFDVADSAAINVSISDADMARFSTVVWHSDVRGSRAIYADTTELREYLDQGGKLILSGWRLSSSLKSGGGVNVTTFPPNSFVPLYLRFDSSLTTGLFVQDFYIANSVLTGYPSLKVDSMKIPNYNGTLVNTDVLLPPLWPGAEVIYTHQGKTPSPQFDGKPVALRYLGPTYKLALFDCPLYYMELPSVQLAMERALMDLNEVVSADEGTPEIPPAYALEQSFPNPFNPAATFEFQIAKEGLVTLKVFDLLGREVATIVNEAKQPGRYKVTWDASQFASGVYFYRLTSGAFSETKKLILMK